MKARGRTGGATAPEGGSADRATAALMHALRRQETWAIEELMRRYRPALLDLARRMRVAPEDRESVVLSVMDDVVLRLIAGATPRSLDAYVLRSFRNSAVLLPRRQRTAQLALVAEHGERCGDAFLVRETVSEYAIHAAIGDAQAAEHPVLDALARHLAAAMSDDERLLLEWRAAHVPAAQIAAWTGRSHGAVRVRVMRLRARLARVASAYRDSLGEPERSAVGRFLEHLVPDGADGRRETSQDAEDADDAD